MQRWMHKSLLVIACLGLFTSAGCSQTPFSKVGNWFREVRDQFKLDSQRNNATPQPFAVQDQQMLPNTFGPMYAKAETTNRILDSVHFNPETHELNKAGKTRVIELLAQRKQLDIFIASTLNPEVDKARATKLKTLLAGYTFPGHKPGVSTTFHLPHHRVGENAASLREAYITNLPPPTLDSVEGNVSGSTQ